MSTDPGTLTIATICREPVLNVLRFVAWHRQLGADRIVIYFDDPADPAIAHITKLDFVEAIPCSPDFWRDLGVDPDVRFVTRQNAAMTAAYRRAATGWVGVLDGDELFYAPEGLKPVLRRLGPDIRSIRIQTSEKISAPGGPWFRDPIDKHGLRALYGDLTPLMRRNRGLVGHAIGKSLTRSGLDLRLIRQHFPVGSDRKELTDLVLGPADGLRLLHFFEQGWESWRRKLDWRLGSWGFAPRMAAHLQNLAAQADDPEAVWRWVYALLHEFDELRLDKLAQFGGLFRPELDLLAPARAMFGADLVDALAAT